jgi:flagellin-like hook-associated protein FlgL
VYLSNGDGTFSQAAYTTVEGEDAFDISVGDLNGDGALDIAVAQPNQGSIDLLINDGNGAFTSGTSISNSSEVTIVGDFDNDGTEDLIGIDTNMISAFIGNGDGTFSSAVSSAITGLSSLEVDIGDFNQDGNLDLALADFSGGTSATVLLGNGDGTFFEGASLSVGGANEIKVSDLNNDGYDDILVQDEVTEVVEIFLGDGGGGFTQNTLSLSGETARNLGVGDINGDGIPDIVQAVAGGGNTMLVFTGNGDGTFTQQDNTSAVSGLANGTEIGDFDNDGVADIISFDRDGFRVVLGNDIQSNTIAYQSLVTQEGAQAAMDVVDEDLERLANERGNIGAFQSRLSSTVANLSHAGVESSSLRLILINSIISNKVLSADGSR